MLEALLPSILKLKFIIYKLVAMSHFSNATIIIFQLNSCLEKLQYLSVYYFTYEIYNYFKY
jgi:hypothetical protein